MKTDSLKEFVNLHRQLIEERSSIETRLREINQALGDLSVAQPSGSAQSAPAAPEKSSGGRRQMSPEAKRRIAEAQRARWAKARGGQQPAKASASSSSNAGAGGGKRRLSDAARKAIAEAARKRWAAAKASGKNKL